MGFDVGKEPEKVRPLINAASGAERAGYDFISARGNLWFFSQLYGLPSAEAHRRINELSAMLGLENYLDRKFYALSTGFRRRVTIVRAFVNDPRVVFLDEPTIGLDVMTAISIREFLLRQAKSRGRTIILATHNMSEVGAICDRVAIIDKGKILACDTPSALKRSLGTALVMEVSPPAQPERLEMLSKLEGVKGYTSTIDEERGTSRVQVVVNSDESAQIVLDVARKSGMNVASLIPLTIGMDALRRTLFTSSLGQPPPGFDAIYPHILALAAMAGIPPSSGDIAQNHRLRRRHTILGRACGQYSILHGARLAARCLCDFRDKIRMGLAHLHLGRVDDIL